ncbi:ATP-binding protein [Herbiconiux sp. CPCC 205716]|uniref:histidine kinase n=1 Tax=Herbiconiux gentiana TaxID=2970912 RepID=A0ABT2GIJ1_9MICO|nr:ATP-binding protein [Herbiconiux gentiana]MCS5714709.1 ATP-binding protein [Herbiconiux gentiana]
MHAILRQWNSISLRTKITGVTVLMLTFGLVVSGVGTMVVLRTYLLQQVDSQLDQASADPSPFLGPNASSASFNIQDITSAPDDYFVGLLDSSGNLIVSNWADRDSGTMPAALVDLDTANQLGGKVFTVDSVDHTAEWHAVTTMVELFGGDGYGTVVIAKSLVETEKTTATYLSIFLAFGIGVVILGAMLTRLLVTSTFGPLREVERTAAAIADGGDFSRRMSDAMPETEVGRLNRSLNTMLSRIDSAFADRARTIDQMRRFVGDASHELRTPLVSVRGYAELYRMGALQTPDDVAQAMDRIEKEAIRMGTLVEDLLELARLDETRPLQLEPVDLLPLSIDAASDARAASPGRVVTVRTPSGPPAVPFSPVLEVSAGEEDVDGFADVVDPADEAVTSTDAGAKPSLYVSAEPRDPSTGSFYTTGPVEPLTPRVDAPAVAEVDAAHVPEPADAVDDPTPDPEVPAGPPVASAPAAGKPGRAWGLPRGGSAFASGQSAARSAAAAPDGTSGAPGTATGPLGTPARKGASASVRSSANAAMARLRRRPKSVGGASGDPTLDGGDEFATGEIELAPAVPPIVLAEENKIRQVLTNLIGNALRFTDADSPIELVVQVDEAAGVAMVDIVDHGDGIPPQIREKIFQRFWRADSSRTRETGGSGLGLAIVSSIIAAHHGTVQALETPGGGATFRVTLPLMDAPTPPAPTPTASTPTPTR